MLFFFYTPPPPPPSAPSPSPPCPPPSYLRNPHSRPGTHSLPRALPGSDSQYPNQARPPDRAIRQRPVPEYLALLRSVVGCAPRRHSCWRACGWSRPIRSSRACGRNGLRRSSEPGKMSRLRSATSVAARCRRCAAARACTLCLAVRSLRFCFRPCRRFRGGMTSRQSSSLHMSAALPCPYRCSCP